MNEAPQPSKIPEVKNPRKIIFDFAKSFLMPTLIGKSFVLYFGINYSQYPGEGYGYGLIVAVVITVFSLLAFAWKYKDQEEL